MKRPFLTWILWLFLAILSFYGLVAGTMMLVSPDGSLLKMDPEWLQGSPFTSYLIPGLLLFFCIGVLPALAIIGMAFQPDWKWARSVNIYPERNWGWTFSLCSGIGTIIWIIVQQFTTKYFILQPVILTLAVCIIVLTLMPGTMRFFSGISKNL